MCLSLCLCLSLVCGRAARADICCRCMQGEALGRGAAAWVAREGSTVTRRDVLVTAGWAVDREGEMGAVGWGREAGSRRWEGG